MADCTGVIEPLNLECLLVNVFAGSMEIFIFFAFIVITIIAAKFKMMNTTFILIFAVFAIIMANFTQGIYFLVLLAAGLIVSLAIGRLAKK